MEQLYTQRNHVIAGFIVGNVIHSVDVYAKGAVTSTCS